MENKVYWKTSEGHVLDIDLMSEQHIKNSFKMLVKQLNEAKKAKCVEEKSSALNGDMANEFNSSFSEEEEEGDFNDFTHNW